VGSQPKLSIAAIDVSKGGVAFFAGDKTAFAADVDAAGAETTFAKAGAGAETTFAADVDAAGTGTTFAAAVDAAEIGRAHV
jgi:hypothetical protein